MGQNPRDGRRRYSALQPSADEIDNLRTNKQVDQAFKDAVDKLDRDEVSAMQVKLEEDRISTWKRHFDALGGS
ncbi:hypothetical protein [Paracoccus cavernae]